MNSLPTSLRCLDVRPIPKSSPEVLLPMSCLRSESDSISSWASAGSQKPSLSSRVLISVVAPVQSEISFCCLGFMGIDEFESVMINRLVVKNHSVSDSLFSF